MKLVLIFGPPAVGKLTVAECLSRITGFKVMHNHLSADYVNSILDRGTPAFEHLVNQIRLLTLQVVRQAADGLIYTLVYSHPEDLGFIEDVERIVGTDNILYVRLTCPQLILEERVVEDSRASFRKVRSVDGLRGMLEKYSLLESIPNRHVLEIDNSDLEPSDAAERILDHFLLSRHP